MFCLSGFWSRDMQNPFSGSAGEGQELAAHSLHHEAGTSPGMLSSKFCATSSPQEKILQIPPPISYRREFPCSEWPKLGQDVRGFADSIVQTSAHIPELPFLESSKHLASGRSVRQTALPEATVRIAKVLLHRFIQI